MPRSRGTGEDEDTLDGPPAANTTLSARALARDAFGRVLMVSDHWLVRRFAIQDPPLPNGDRSRVKREADGTWRREWDSGRFELFDAEGRLTTRSRRSGDTDTFAYDAQGRITTRSDAAGGTWSFAYSPTNGKLTAITDPASRTTLFEVDANGDLVAVELPEQQGRQVDGACRGECYGPPRARDPVELLILRRFPRTAGLVRLLVSASSTSAALLAGAGSGGVCG